MLLAQQSSTTNSTNRGGFRSPVFAAGAALRAGALVALAVLLGNSGSSGGSTTSLFGLAARVRHLDAGGIQELQKRLVEAERRALEAEAAQAKLEQRLGDCERRCVGGADSQLELDSERNGWTDSKASGSAEHLDTSRRPPGGGTSESLRGSPTAALLEARAGGAAVQHAAGAAGAASAAGAAGAAEVAGASRASGEGTIRGSETDISELARFDMMTCQFAIDNEVTSVVYNNVDITASVNGDLAQWNAIRSFSVQLVQGAFLVISGKNYDDRGSQCHSAGFVIKCDKYVNTSSAWETVGSSTPFPSKDVRLRGGGAGWVRAGGCSSASIIPVPELGPTKIWAASDTQYAAFRVQPLREMMTCQFTIDNEVTSVVYNDVDITSSVTGNLLRWDATHSFSVQLAQDAYLVISGRNYEEAGSQCESAGFVIKCDRYVDTSSAWETVGSRTTFADQDVRLRGGGTGWVRVGGCSSASLVPELGPTQIWAGSDDPYAAFRVQPLTDQMTCQFSLDGEVTAVFYNDIDITSSVQGSLNGRGGVRNVTFSLVLNARLAIAGRNPQASSGGCEAPGFVVKCEARRVSASQWDSVGSTAPFSVEDPRLKGFGSGWNPSATCRGRSADPSLGSEVIWPGADLPFVIFRTQPLTDGTGLSLTGKAMRSLVSERDVGKRLIAIEALALQAQSWPEEMVDDLLATLETLLADPSAAVRSQSARTAAKILAPQKAQSVESFIGALCAALEVERDMGVMEVMVSVARGFGLAAKPILPSVLRIMGQVQGEASTLRAAILTLQDFGEKSTAARQALSRLVASATSSDIRALACEALWSMQDAAESEVATLGRALSQSAEPSAEVRAAAARALGAAGFGAVRVLDRVVEAAGDRAWQVRLEAARILARFGRELEPSRGQRAAILLKRSMLDEVPSGSPPAVRVAATLALGSLGRSADIVLKDLEAALLTSGLLDVRKAAQEALQQLSSQSPAAKDLWTELQETLGQAFSDFNATALGRTKPSEALALAKRSFSTGLRFVGDDCSACWPAAGRGLERKQQGQGQLSSRAFAIPLPRSVLMDPAASCAALCARATPFVIDQASESLEAFGAFKSIFLDPNHTDWEGALRVDARRLAGYCVAFAVVQQVQGPSCLLFQTMPASNSVSSSGGSPIFAFHVPSSVSFCAKAWGQRKASNESLVSECKQKLVNDVSLVPSTANKLNTQKVSFICEEECIGLVQRIKDIEEMPDYVPERRDFDLASLGRTSTSSEIVQQVSLADACTRNVVQLVEFQHIKCCATACGWNFQTRQCEGATLFDPADFARWQGECCTAQGIIRGTDRERMCRSAVRQRDPRALEPSAGTELAARGESEGAEVGQELSPSLNRTDNAPEGVALRSWLQLGSRWVLASARVPPQPPLTEAGYRAAVNKGNAVMADFVTRVVHSLGAVVVNVGGLNGFVQHYSGDRSTKSYEQLLAEVRALSEKEGSWVRPEAATSPCRLECSEPAFLALVLTQCSSRARQEWFATTSTQLCQQELRNITTASPAKCAEEARAAQKKEFVDAASWRLVRVLDGRAVGVCRLYRSCRQQLDAMRTRTRASMNNMTETLWAPVVPTV